MTDDDTAPIETPCIRTCRVDPASRLCVGCLRSMEEIGHWGGMSPAERRRIMAELPARRGRISPDAAALGALRRKRG
ncbi:DUF1289 domain-containing protein [Rhodovulum sulfidophilum]|uniref:DUF1289 domain-containing protein n=1 Tax=Rhodovulum sulfidophilum TaxID=35806 RepID=UPI0005A6D083|nr:DUF1289 domain-containing protein [Rhodovulum sulfidophilum]ANB34742.1 hypothetical protein A6W98_12140 [Rhodovulum sulfidophilum DSM 1374]ANB38565.1 hypothetical protein A6024_12005 [Rhodovulum sulfidophilum]MBL3550849.1 DUF1289 domain-containing protein [Rhodovulum sulfidophilum]MBL3562374.1 DUF1289 domain-containing protein [Rhodovulum sulfidophilum]MCW2302047.1 putative Fe-S protein YdhL (DUF1289 family) [Rhodovulum sulfidophilum]